MKTKGPRHQRVRTLIYVALFALVAGPLALAQEILPFPPTPSASVAGRTMAESTHRWRVEPQRLKNPPNIIIIILDDAGFAQSDTFGGEIHTPTMTRLAQTGIVYNEFHTTAMCSPTRAALLTGRNQHRLGSGQIAEFASDFEGYSGTIPKTAATVAEVLRCYGYNTVALGKWHNTPIRETTAMGPFDHWPTGYGFDYFYGFIGGETSQWEPRLFQNTTPIEPPEHDPTYHLTTDLADHAINWIRTHELLAPEKPFFMYWAPGAVHGPHHIFKQWADKYAGKFDTGWDAYRDRVFARQKAMGWIPDTAQLTPRPDSLPAWDSIPPDERKFQARLMEVFAGFLEHTDAQAGRIVDELEKEGIRNNTIIFYVFSDNGASAEGMQGTISELLAQNGIPTTTTQQIAAMQQYGGLDALGGPKMDNMYNAAWAWASESPFQGTKLLAGYFGGTRTPLAISWPNGIKPDPTPRPQFHHVNDIVPTIYDILGITPPRIVNGYPQDSIDGISMTYTFPDPKAPSRKGPQYFEVMGSRGIYEDRWMASVWGPRTPWVADVSGLFSWNPDNDKWSLYDLRKDYSQANDLSAQMPQKLQAMKDTFTVEAARNNVFPIGGSLYTVLNPSQMISSTRTDLVFPGNATRVPEFMVTGIKNRDNVVTVDAELGEKSSGVLYALGGMSGGLTLFMDQGILHYEYNSLEIERTKIKSDRPLPAGKVKIEVETVMSSPQRAAPASITLRVNGAEVARGNVNLTVPALFTATETFDVGRDLGSPVSLDYAERAPFPFDGKIEQVRLKYSEKSKPVELPPEPDVAD
jgi:arylsulfatase